MCTLKVWEVSGLPPMTLKQALRGEVGFSIWAYKVLMF